MTEACKAGPEGWKKSFDIENVAFLRGLRKIYEPTLNKCVLIFAREIRAVMKIKTLSLDGN